MGRIVALDFGERRIGVAVSDPMGMIAQPAAVLAAGETFEHDLRNLVADWDVESVVVGLPTNLDGTEGESARAARAFAARVGELLGVPIELYDERFSSVLAERAMLEGGVSRRERRRRSDGVAAAVFLQGYLDERR
jgi:putative Holliday junction resolvase